MMKMMMKSKPPILPITNDPSKSYLASSSSSMFVHQTTNYELPNSHILISPIEDDNHYSLEKKPLLSRSFSFTGKPTNSTQQQRRRRCTSDDNLFSGANGGEQDSSLSTSVEHAAAESYLITSLSFKLLGYLGRIRRGIVYGDQPRNSLDLYLPKNNDGPKPVVAFVTGGAWIIGYKAWGSLLGQQLSDRDIMVACIDYRNFPQGTMRDMIEDASRGISFVCKNIEEYGGDPSRIYLMGQSAGAHISACTLIEQAIKEAGGEGESVSWSVSQIKAYFGLSGGYNLLNLVDHFHNRGLYRSIFLSIMGGEQSLRNYSPEIVVQDPNVRNAVSLLPPMILFHGTADYSIPSDDSVKFAETLRGLGVEAQAILYEGKTHTDVFLQDPMRGGNDPMFEDLFAIIHADDEDGQAKDAMAPQIKRMVPEIMLKLARAVSPF